jgi:hypothetical protein
LINIAAEITLSSNDFFFFENDSNLNVHNNLKERVLVIWARHVVIVIKFSVLRFIVDIQTTDRHNVHFDLLRWLSPDAWGGLSCVVRYIIKCKANMTCGQCLSNGDNVMKNFDILDAGNLDDGIETPNRILLKF